MFLWPSHSCRAQDLDKAAELKKVSGSLCPYAPFCGSPGCLPKYSSSSTPTSPALRCTEVAVEAALIAPLEIDQGRRPPSFDPYLVPSGPLRVLADEVARLALNVERHIGLRKRARRPRDLRVFHETVAALITNAVYVQLLERGSFRVTLDRSRLARRSRYASELLSEQLPKLLDLLDRHMLVLRVLRASKRPLRMPPGRPRCSQQPVACNRCECQERTLAATELRSNY